MNKSGFLRRVVILLAFGFFYSVFVLSNSQISMDEDHRKWLHWLLIGTITWGIVSMWADRMAPPKDGKEEKDDNE